RPDDARPDHAAGAGPSRKVYFEGFVGAERRAVVGRARHEDGRGHFVVRCLWQPPVQPDDEDIALHVRRDGRLVNADGLIQHVALRREGLAAVHAARHPDAAVLLVMSLPDDVNDAVLAERQFWAALAADRDRLRTRIEAYRRAERPAVVPAL